MEKVTTIKMKREEIQELIERKLGFQVKQIRLSHHGATVVLAE